MLNTKAENKYKSLTNILISLLKSYIYHEVTYTMICDPDPRKMIKILAQFLLPELMY